MVASFLAVGPAPVAAIEASPDAPATWKACVGAATANQAFIDVPARSVHSTSINCLAYYGITVGKTERTFALNDHVTHSQMALILTRAAAVADIDLGLAADAGFTDIDMVSAEKRNAINRLAAKGIMKGETELIEPASANTVRPRLPAVEAVIAGGSSTHVRMGSSVTYTVQFVDEDGDPVGPPGGGEDGFIGVVSKIRQNLDSVSGAPIEDDPDTFPDEAFESAVEIERVNLPELLVPDSGGRFTVTVTRPDRNAGVNDPDVGVRVTLEPVPGNDLKIVDMATPMGTVNRPPGASSVVTSWTLPTCDSPTMIDVLRWPHSRRLRGVCWSPVCRAGTASA